MSGKQKWFLIMFSWGCLAYVLKSLGIGWQDILPMIIIVGLPVVLDEMVRKENEYVVGDDVAVYDQHDAGVYSAGDVASEDIKAVRST